MARINSGCKLSNKINLDVAGHCFICQADERQPFETTVNECGEKISVSGLLSFELNPLCRLVGLQINKTLESVMEKESPGLTEPAAKMHLCPDCSCLYESLKKSVVEVKLSQKNIKDCLEKIYDKIQLKDHGLSKKQEVHVNRNASAFVVKKVASTIKAKLAERVGETVKEMNCVWRLHDVCNLQGNQQILASLGIHKPRNNSQESLTPDELDIETVPPEEDNPRNAASEDTITNFIAPSSNERNVVIVRDQINQENGGIAVPEVGSESAAPSPSTPSQVGLNTLQPNSNNLGRRIDITLADSLTSVTRMSIDTLEVVNNNLQTFPLPQENAINIPLGVKFSVCTKCRSKNVQPTSSTKKSSKSKIGPASKIGRQPYLCTSKESSCENSNFNAGQIKSPESSIQPNLDDLRADQLLQNPALIPSGQSSNANQQMEAEVIQQKSHHCATLTEGQIDANGKESHANGPNKASAYNEEMSSTGAQRASTSNTNNEGSANHNNSKIKGRRGKPKRVFSLPKKKKSKSTLGYRPYSGWVYECRLCPCRFSTTRGINLHYKTDHNDS